MIEVKNVTMQFDVYKENVDNLKEYFIKKVKRQISCEKFTALNDISLNIGKGEAVGLVGTNGSGKSTLLKIIAGVLKPTLGTVKCNGKIAPLIELGAGFDPDLTARENIFLNGAILGYSRKFLEDNFNNIIEFAELQDFVDVPIKNYSSGMFARLGFSIATISKPDILIIDEVLSVGDFRFQEKCEARMSQLMDGDTTILFVSHDIEQVKRICNRAIVLKHGNILCDESVEKACEIYYSNN